MKKDNIQLTTAGKLLKDLKRFENNHWDLSVVAWTDDDRTFGVVGTWEDEDGDFQIVVEEVDEVLEGIRSVADVISSLEDISKETRVYMAGDGYYFAIDGNGSSIFTEADDDDAVGCWVTVFGEYEEKEDEVEDSRVVDDARPKGWEGILEVFTYLLVILLSAYGLYYNIAALVRHSGPVWESILWIIFLGLLLYVCIDNLFFPNRHK
jgi:hypothetical protein